MRKIKVEMRQRIFVKMIEPELYRKYESSEWDSLCAKSQIQTANLKVGMRQRIFVKIIEPEFNEKYESSEQDSLCTKYKKSDSDGEIMRY